MLAQVTNRARGARGFDTLDRGTVLLEPGETAKLDLDEHPLHRAWAACGEVSIEPLGGAEPAEARLPLKKPGRADRKTP